MEPPVRTIILDLGGVVLDWDYGGVTALPKQSIVAMLNSVTWHEFERGHVSLSRAHELLAQEMNLDPAAIEQALLQMVESLYVNHELVAAVVALRQATPGLEVVIMSNISHEHFDVVRKLPLPWDMFSATFPSAGAGMRKPDLCFFRHVLGRLGRRQHPGSVVLVDDKAENVCAARSLGIRAILVRGDSCDSNPVVIRSLRNMVGPDPVARGRAFLRAGAGRHHGVIGLRGKEIAVKENFDQLLILQWTGEEDLVYLTWPGGDGQSQSKSQGQGQGTAASAAAVAARHRQTPAQVAARAGLWNYFSERPVITDDVFPPDLDTTSTAYLSIPPARLARLAAPELVMDAMAENVGPDGVVQVYFDRARPRTSPEVCVNVLRFFARFGHADDRRMRETEDWVIACIANRACSDGTRFYSFPESFLYFAAELYAEPAASKRLRVRLVRAGLRDALAERVNTAANSIALALRVRACQLLGLAPALIRPDLDRLRMMQEPDGGWPAGHYCLYGKTGATVGSRGMTTALALVVLRHEREAARAAAAAAPPMRGKGLRRPRRPRADSAIVIDGSE